MKTNKKEKPEVLMTLPQALERVIDEKKVTRKEWADVRWYCFFSKKDGLLALHKAGEAKDKFWAWVINEGDLLATDWIEL